MANYYFTTPTTDEAPFMWNPLGERFRITRGISIKQTAPGANYVQVRFDSYTNELATIAAGLNFFRGGYQWIVNDATRTDLINAGVGVTAANFTLIT